MVLNDCCSCLSCLRNNYSEIKRNNSNQNSGEVGRQNSSNGILNNTDYEYYEGDCSSDEEIVIDFDTENIEKEFLKKEYRIDKAKYPLFASVKLTFTKITQVKPFIEKEMSNLDEIGIPNLLKEYKNHCNKVNPEIPLDINGLKVILYGIQENNFKWKDIERTTFDALVSIFLESANLMPWEFVRMYLKKLHLTFFSNEFLLKQNFTQSSLIILDFLIGVRQKKFLLSWSVIINSIFTDYYKMSLINVKPKKIEVEFKNVEKDVVNFFASFEKQRKDFLSITKEPGLRQAYNEGLMIEI